MRHRDKTGAIIVNMNGKSQEIKEDIHLFLVWFLPAQTELYILFSLRI